MDLKLWEDVTEELGDCEHNAFMESAFLRKELQYSEAIVKAAIQACDFFSGEAGRKACDFLKAVPGKASNSADVSTEQDGPVIKLLSKLRLNRDRGFQYVFSHGVGYRSTWEDIDVITVIRRCVEKKVIKSPENFLAFLQEKIDVLAVEWKEKLSKEASGGTVAKIA
ncbi:MAG: hypothetical protein M3Q73_01220 [bacterium]|nr:hypothetical protein [bacterium]